MSPRWLRVLMLAALFLLPAAANAHVEILQGDDPIESILQYAYGNGITQIFVGHSQQEGSGWLSRWRVNPVERLIMESEGIDVRIFPTVDGIGAGVVSP